MDTLFVLTFNLQGAFARQGQVALGVDSCVGAAAGGIRVGGAVRDGVGGTRGGVDNDLVRLNNVDCRTGGVGDGRVVQDQADHVTVGCLNLDLALVGAGELVVARLGDGNDAVADGHAVGRGRVRKIDSDFAGGIPSQILRGVVGVLGELRDVYKRQVEGVPANSNPAKIINLSLGGEGTCPATYSKAIAEVNKRGAILVVAAGNDGQDTSKVAPANCGGSIVVGATDQNGKRSDFSNYGKIVDVSAPGSNIMSTVDLGTTVSTGAGYTEYDGTSMAAPQVAGVIALMKSVDPSLNAERAKQILKQSSKPLTCDVNGCGSGIVNAASALAMVQGKKDPNPQAKPWPKRAPKHPTRAARVGYVTNPAVNHNPPFLITAHGLIPGQ